MKVGQIIRCEVYYHTIAYVEVTKVLGRREGIILYATGPGESYAHMIGMKIDIGRQTKMWELVE